MRDSVSQSVRQYLLERGGEGGGTWKEEEEEQEEEEKEAGEGRGEGEEGKKLYPWKQHK